MIEENEKLTRIMISYLYKNRLSKINWLEDTMLSNKKESILTPLTSMLVYLRTLPIYDMNMTFDDMIVSKKTFPNLYAKIAHMHGKNVIIDMLTIQFDLDNKTFIFKSYTRNDGDIVNEIPLSTTEVYEDNLKNLLENELGKLLRTGLDPDIREAAHTFERIETQLHLKHVIDILTGYPIYEYSNRIVEKSSLLLLDSVQKGTTRKMMRVDSEVDSSLDYSWNNLDMYINQMFKSGGIFTKSISIDWNCIEITFNKLPRINIKFIVNYSLADSENALSEELFLLKYHTEVYGSSSIDTLVDKFLKMH